MSVDLERIKYRPARSLEELEEADIDGVGRAQRPLSAQLPVVERRLDHRLAVIEGALDLQGRDVASHRRQLLLLERADPARGVEQHHVNGLHA